MEKDDFFSEEKSIQRIDKSIFYDSKNSHETTDDKILKVQNRIRAAWQRFFSSIEVVLILVGMNGGLLGLINNGCSSSLIQTSMSGTVVIGLQVFFTTMLIISHVDFNITLLWKFFLIFCVGWFTSLEILGFYSIHYSESLTPCNPPLVWGSDSMFGFLFLMGMLIGLIVYCFKGNYATK